MPGAWRRLLLTWSITSSRTCQRQWVLSFPIPLRLLLAAQAKLLTPVQVGWVQQHASCFLPADVLAIKHIFSLLSVILFGAMLSPLKALGIAVSIIGVALLVLG